MLGDVADVFLRIKRVPGGLAVVIDLRPGHHVAKPIDKLIAGQVARHADADLVGVEQQPVQRVWLIVAVGIGVQPVAKTLGLQRITAVKRTAAAHRIAQPVAKRADAGARQVELGGVDAAGIVGHLAKVPALAVEVNLGAVHAVFGQRQLVQRSADVEHVAHHVVAHQVKAEGIDLVHRRPGHQRIDHQFFHHGVFAGGVFTAGTALDGPAVVQAVVVARHDAVQHRFA